MSGYNPSPCPDQSLLPVETANGVSSCWSCEPSNSICLRMMPSPHLPEMGFAFAVFVALSSAAWLLGRPRKRRGAASWAAPRLRSAQ